MCLPPYSCSITRSTRPPTLPRSQSSRPWRTKTTASLARRQSWTWARGSVATQPRCDTCGCRSWGVKGSCGEGGDRGGLRALLDQHATPLGSAWVGRGCQSTARLPGGSSPSTDTPPPLSSLSPPFLSSPQHRSCPARGRDRAECAPPHRKGAGGGGGRRRRPPPPHGESRNLRAGRAQTCASLAGSPCCPQSSTLPRHQGSHTRR